MADIKSTNYMSLHGRAVDSSNNYHPWLKRELEKAGATVIIPDMPNTDAPDAEEQSKFVLDNYRLNKNSVLIAHSYGSVTALLIVEALDKPIKKLVIVAGFAQPGFLGNRRSVVEQTTNWDFDFDKIKQNAGQVVILRASNDTVVPVERADFLQEKLGGSIVDFTAEKNHVCGEVEPIVLKAALTTV